MKTITNYLKKIFPSLAHIYDSKLKEKDCELYGLKSMRIIVREMSDGLHYRVLNPREK